MNANVENGFLGWLHSTKVTQESSEQESAAGYGKEEGMDFRARADQVQPAVQKVLLETDRREPPETRDFVVSVKEYFQRSHQTETNVFDNSASRDPTRKTASPDFVPYV